MWNLILITFLSGAPMWSSGGTYDTEDACLDAGYVIWQTNKAVAPQQQMFIGCLSAKQP